MSTDYTKLPPLTGEIVRLARLDPAERFTKENIKKLHEGLAPWYEFFTWRELPNDVIVVGFGCNNYIAGFGFGKIFNYSGCNGFIYRGDAVNEIYYCRKEEAIKRGWWEKPKKMENLTLLDCMETAKKLGKKCKAFKYGIMVCAIGEDGNVCFHSWNTILQISDLTRSDFSLEVCDE